MVHIYPKNLTNGRSKEIRTRCKGKDHKGAETLLWSNRRPRPGYANKILYDPPT